MSDPKLNLPEPLFAEHALIRDSAPIPELSAGFKSRVLSDCKLSIAKSGRIRRWKIGGATTLACCLGLLICLSIPDSPQVQDQVVEQPPSASQPHYSSPGSLGFPSSPGGVAVDMPKPKSVRDPEKSQMNQMMESLNNRQQLFDANMFGL